MRFEPSRCGLPRLCGVGRSANLAHMATPVPQLAARGLTKSFGGGAFLRGAALDAAGGARIGILGPKGGGKWTLLRILAGLAAAEGGEVTRRRGLVVAHLPQIVA